MKQSNVNATVRMKNITQHLPFIIFILLFILFMPVVQAQTDKLPPSFKYVSVIPANPANYQLEFKKDVQKLLEEDRENVKLGMPLRIAVGTDVSLKLDRQTASHTVLPANEQVWHYAIRSEGAKGLIVTFDELFLPEGDELYVYTKDRKQLNIFTSATNPSGNAYATDALASEEIIFEYVPASPLEIPARIHISNIAYVYKSPDEMLADDLSCYINTNCSEADNWQLQKNGVVRLLIQDAAGWGYCSGSLINNVREDETPYVLTANHCVDGYQGQVFSTLKFDFFAETSSTDCHIQTESSPYTKTLTGATLLATTAINGSSDGSLLKINTPVPEDWEVYYNGWDAREIAAMSGVSIHHPNAYVKKISTFKNPLVSTGNIPVKREGRPLAITGPDAHWEVVWSPTENGHSVTYGGSSGSPIFNQDGLIVGTLTGGGAYCKTPHEVDLYGKFSCHWDKHSNSQQHFKNYLDPDNTGTLTLGGYNPHGIVLEGKPIAVEATEITPVGFTANWNMLENATKYYLDVYRKGENNAIEYITGFEAKNVGDILSYAVTGLEHACEYYYVIRAGYRSQITEASNEISVTTQPPTFEYFFPVATDASDISAVSFTANWEELPEATSYLLSVYQKIAATDSTEIVDFTNRILPAGWKKNSISYYSQEGQFGQSAPALQLGADGSIESPVYYEAVKALSFWYRGISANSSNSLVVLGYVFDEWKEIKRIRPLNNGEGETVSIPLEEIPQGTVAVKILHERVGGYISIDDIQVDYGTFAYKDYVHDFDSLNVENVTHQIINDLNEDTTYYYSIVGFNGEKYSRSSNEIAVKTDTLAFTSVDFLQNENKTTVRVDYNYIHIHSGVSGNVFVYNIIGKLMITRPLSAQNTRISRIGLPAGVYFIKTGNEIFKILLR
ncbi:MAG: T9SS type A sorting domain-containing protein [Dysgonamonadaceae bacterium]|jgi:hypothetical protein|nr:T9SS type A sorting domain-containing protein [Dysgonamonadaceae bacterium]